MGHHKPYEEYIAELNALCLATDEETSILARKILNDRLNLIIRRAFYLMRAILC